MAKYARERLRFAHHFMNRSIWTFDIAARRYTERRPGLAAPGSARAQDGVRVRQGAQISGARKVRSGIAPVNASEGGTLPADFVERFVRENQWDIRLYDELAVGPSSSAIAGPR
jgi:hypothetical protein